MNTLSAILKSLLILMILCCSSIYAADRLWPVKGDISLSSSFCDFRKGHFHGGIDIRTEGVEGRKIYSPVDGYIWRIRHSYIGYGKGLYVKDSQGFIYVFGHLSRLSKKLDKVVKSYQYKNKRYYFDLFFEPDSLPVKQGELIAYSGQSGYGAPHIHFEIRNPANQPLNPLTNDFNLDDKLPPEFEAVGFIYQDNKSIFLNGKRRSTHKTKYDKIEQRYTLDDPVILTGPFGIEIKAFDRIRERTRKLNIYQAKLYIDNYLYYEIGFEKYDYAQTAMVDLTYNYSLTVDEKEYWHLLYKPTGNDFDGSTSSYRDGGVYKARSAPGYGIHEARIEICDASGNMSRLVFDFVVLPTADLFRSEWINDSTVYFMAHPENRSLKISGVEIFGTTGAKGWKAFDPERVKMGRSSDYYVTLPYDSRTRPSALKLEVYGETGWGYDLHFGLVNSDKQKYRLDYELLADGILFDVFSQIRYAPPPIIKVFYEDGYVDTVYSTVVKPDKYAAFYRNDKIKTRIVRFETFNPLTELLSDSKDVDMFLGGVGPDALVYANKNGLKIKIDPDDFYVPTQIEPYRLNSVPKKSGEVVGHAYLIRPQTAPLENSITVSFEVNQNIDKSKIGMYCLNNKNEWNWVNSKIEGGRISGEAGKTGTYAVLIDTEAPRVKNINPKRGRKVKASYPLIACVISEELSGIENDQNISVRLDGRWLIPEYDPETEQLKTYPDRALTAGRHELVITVTDRVGNKREVFSHFFVEGK